MGRTSSGSDMATITSLPFEVLASKIFPLLSDTELAKCRFVCRLFHELACENALWKKECKQRGIISNKNPKLSWKSHYFSHMHCGKWTAKGTISTDSTLEQLTLDAPQLVIQFSTDGSILGMVRYNHSERASATVCPLWGQWMPREKGSSIWAPLVASWTESFHDRDFSYCGNLVTKSGNYGLTDTPTLVGRWQLVTHTANLNDNVSGTFSFVLARVDEEEEIAVYRDALTLCGDYKVIGADHDLNGRVYQVPCVRVRFRPDGGINGESRYPHEDQAIPPFVCPITGFWVIDDHSRVCILWSTTVLGYELRYDGLLDVRSGTIAGRWHTVLANAVVAGNHTLGTFRYRFRHFPSVDVLADPSATNADAVSEGESDSDSDEEEEEAAKGSDAEPKRPPRGLLPCFGVSAGATLSGMAMRARMKAHVAVVVPALEMTAMARINAARALAERSARNAARFEAERAEWARQHPPGAPLLIRLRHGPGIAHVMATAQRGRMPSERAASSPSVHRQGPPPTGPRPAASTGAPTPTTAAAAPPPPRPAYADGGDTDTEEMPTASHRTASPLVEDAHYPSAPSSPCVPQRGRRRNHQLRTVTFCDSVVASGVVLVAFPAVRAIAPCRGGGAGGGGGGLLGVSDTAVAVDPHARLLDDTGDDEDDGKVEVKGAVDDAGAGAGAECALPQCASETPGRMRARQMVWTRLAEERQRA